MSDSVIIEPITKDDHHGLFRLVSSNRARLHPYFPVTCSRCTDPRATRTYIKEMIAAGMRNTLHCFAMRDYEEGAPIGLVFLKEFDRSVPKCETAYFISGDYEGRGLTTMALMWTMDLAFTTMGMERVYARVDPENMGSRRVLEHCGFLEEGVLRHDFRLPDGRLIDLVIYGRTR